MTMHGTQSLYPLPSSRTSLLGQALLANIASLYGVYHGPKGLSEIADRVHGLAATLAAGAKKLGLQVRRGRCPRQGGGGARGVARHGALRALPRRPAALRCCRGPRRAGRRMPDRRSQHAAAPCSAQPTPGVRPHILPRPPPCRPAPQVSSSAFFDTVAIKVADADKVVATGLKHKVRACGVCGRGDGAEGLAGEGVGGRRRASLDSGRPRLAL